MKKTFASLIVTLVVSVMGIPAAYLVGQRSAEDALFDRYQDEMAQTRAEQRELIASLRMELESQSTDRARPDFSMPEASAGAEIRVNDPEPRATAIEPAQPVTPPIEEEAFEAAELGTPYEVVVEQFGREGAPILTLEEGTGSVTTQYVWDWRGIDGTQGRVLMEFVDGLLIDKTIRD